VRLLERAEQQHQVAAREFARLEGSRILGIGDSGKQGLIRNCRSLGVSRGWTWPRQSPHAHVANSRPFVSSSEDRDPYLREVVLSCPLSFYRSPVASG
jgi:hypothetical protein